MIEHSRIATRRAILTHALRTAGQNDADGRARGNLCDWRVEREDLAVDGQLAQSASDELCELGAEIQNDDGLVSHGGNAIIRCGFGLHHNIL